MNALASVVLSIVPAAAACASPTAAADAAPDGAIARPGTRDGAGLAYRWVEPGMFEMGCVAGDADCRDDERPARRVTIGQGFWMSTTEVTVGAFARFVEATGYVTTAERTGVGGVLTAQAWENRAGASWRDPGFPQDESHPVVLVSWDDAVAFCRWAGGRLPTEAEWEHAARAGRPGERFVWGTAAAPVREGRPQANVADRTAAGLSVPAFDVEYDDGWAWTAPVGSFGANAFGLHDMAGNVLEWCADARGDDHRAARGGSWNNPSGLLRVSRRSLFGRAATLNILGFRCVRDGAP